MVQKASTSRKNLPASHLHDWHGRLLRVLQMQAIATLLHRRCLLRLRTAINTCCG